MKAEPSFRLRPRERLTRRSEFTHVMDRGRRFSSDGIRLRYLRNDLAWSRLGLAVGRRAGGAVRRNRIRRVLREAYRVTKHRLPWGIDVVALPAPGAEVTFEGAAHAFSALADVLRRGRREGP